MLKKLLSILLVISIINFSYLPVLANEKSEHAELAVQLLTEIDVNKASKGQIVQFKSIEDYKDEYGRNIPSGTVFQGKVKSVKHCRWAFRRAKAHIFINRMMLPNGQQFKIRAFTKPRVIKGSAIGNIGKGVVCTPAALVVGAGGLCLIVIETVSIVGIALVAPTAAAVCGTVGKLTNGVNCYKPEGSEFTIKIKKNMPPQKIQPQSERRDLNTNDYGAERDNGGNVPDDNVLDNE